MAEPASPERPCACRSTQAHLENHVVACEALPSLHSWPCGRTTQTHGTRKHVSAFDGSGVVDGVAHVRERTAITQDTTSAMRGSGTW